MISLRNILKLRKLKFPVQQFRYASDGEGKATKGLVVGVYERENSSDETPKLTTAGEHYDSRNEGKILDIIKE